MRVLMKKTVRGADDGFTVREYRVGQEYDLPGTPRGLELGATFLREGWASEPLRRQAGRVPVVPGTKPPPTPSSQPPPGKPKEK